MLSTVLTIAGVALLFVGGEALVRGSVALAEKIGISALLVGMTIVAAGTSAPELVVSVDAAINGNTGIALGNVVGSNIVNVLLILGLSAVMKPIAVKPREIRRDLYVLLAATLALAVFASTGLITRPMAAILLVGQVAYVVLAYLAEKRRPTEATELYEHEAEDFEAPERAQWVNVAYVVVGIGMLIVGSRLLVSGASEIARTLGVSEAVIGLTLVAVGTSLPELATSVVAAVRGHSDVAVGNVVGSNIFNSLLIIGAAGLVTPLSVPAQIATFDVWIMFAVSIATALVLWRGRIGRLVGATGMALYVGYLVWVF